MPIKQKDVRAALAREIINARVLLEQARQDPSVTGEFNDWELRAAETFGNIHEYCENQGIGIHSLLRLLAGSEAVHILKDGTLLDTTKERER